MALCSKLESMKIAAYCRLSVAQDVSVSIEGQKAILARYAEAHGYETTFYIDDGFSGSKSVERPAYNRMIAAIQRGEHELIAVKSIDRLGRRLGAFIELADIAQIVAVEGGIDTGTATGRMMLSLLSTFAEFESQAMGARQVSSQSYRRELGRSVGLAPFGYTTEERSDGVYRVLDSVTAPIARAIIERTLKGASFGGTAQWLNDHGHKTKTGKLWTSTTVSQWLALPQIVGERASGGDVLRGDNGVPIIDAHLALCSITEHQQLLKRRRQRAAFTPRGERREEQLLSGLACCAECGKAMSRHTPKSGTNTYLGYRCGSSVNLCKSRPVISASKLENFVLGEMQGLADMAVLQVVNDEDFEAQEKRLLLQREIDALATAMASAPSDQIADIATQISELRREADGVVVSVKQTVVDTGTTFEELLNEDPRFAIEQAIQQINVKGTATKAQGVSTRERVENRVLIIWDDVEDYDSDYDNLEPVIADSTETGRVFKSQGVHGNQEVPLALHDSEASKLKTLDRMTTGTH